MSRQPRSQSPQQQISASEYHIDESGQRCWGIDVSRLSKESYSHNGCRKGSRAKEYRNVVRSESPKGEGWNTPSGIAVQSQYG
jgi:hypothetical protein